MRLAGIVIVLLLLAACAPAAESGLPDLPEGDPANGEVLFNEVVNGAPSCAGCHLFDTEATAIGPHLVGYAQTAAERVDGQSVYEYTYESIVQPARYVVPGYSSIMYGQYRQSLDDQQLADVIAYLLTLEETTDD